MHTEPMNGRSSEYFHAQSVDLFAKDHAIGRYLKLVC
jgi:hypothetical protein